MPDTIEQVIEWYAQGRARSYVAGQARRALACGDLRRHARFALARPEHTLRPAGPQLKTHDCLHHGSPAPGAGLPA